MVVAVALVQKGARNLTEMPRLHLLLLLSRVMKSLQNNFLGQLVRRVMNFRPEARGQPRENLRARSLPEVRCVDLEHQLTLSRVPVLSVKVNDSTLESLPRVTGLPEAEVWYADSGSSQHLLSSTFGVTDYKPNDRKVVKTASGHLVQVIGSGN